MWLLVSREPLPDTPYWGGRRWLALLDALLWPLFWVAAARYSDVPSGIVGAFVIAIGVLLALKRAYCALWTNHRYRFTTWRWGRIVATLFLFGFLLKLAMLS
jgi:hypothetical protein